MLIYVKLAWKNLFRNKRRSFIAGTAIGMGLAALIFVDALVVGMLENMVQSATATFLGEGQIHRAGFRETQKTELTANRLDWLTANLQQEKIVEHFSLRALAFGMMSSPANLSAVGMIGIDPSSEKYLSQIDDAIIKGSYFADGNERDIVIGSKMAETLEVGLGDRVVVTVAQAKTGDLAQEMFRISGIYQFKIPEMDQGMAFVLLPKAQSMLGLDENVHEIAVKFFDINMGQNESLEFWSKYSQFGNEALGWTKLLPQLKAAMDLSQFSIYITGLILFGIIALGIVNALFMSLHERMFEFGVLRAVGTRPVSIAGLIVLEAGSLGILSIILGSIIGFAVTYLAAHVGIDYRGIEFAGTTFRDFLYPVLRVKQFIEYPILVFLLTSIVGIYPALFAARMLPAEAMRRSL